MDNPDWRIAMNTALATLEAMLKDMRTGALTGCDPTWAAHLAAGVHEAITAINAGLDLLEKEPTAPTDVDEVKR